MLYEVKEEHERYVERTLEALSEADTDIKAMAIVIVLKDDVCIASWENASVNDLLLMQGHMGLMATRRYLEINYPSVINDDNRENFEDEEDE